MIITKLQGGLANQLFQWAYGKYLSEKYNTSLYLDIDFYQSQFGVTQRSFSLPKFTNLNYDLLPKNISIPNLITLSDNFNFQELNYDSNLNYYLNGYWQSEKYFYQIEDIIRNQLKPSDDVIKKLESIQRLDNKNVSIHIRRTDYVSSNGFHPVQSISYYENALNKISEYENILVFSDDIQWCKDNLHFNNMIFIEGFDDVEDIWLMSMCKNNIIANSSFSWWGAWLNSNKDKKVIAPKKWFGSMANLNESDLIPDNWIRID
jgi:hypothetical protein